MVVLKPNVVKGGRAIGLGNNLYLMKGRTHSKGGIDIGKNPKTGLEVENNEVMQVSPQGVRVFSAQPILGGISPAQYILGGANPNQVFNAQEQWKKVNRINDDGTRKARFGTEEDSKRDSSQVNIFRPSQDNSKVQANRIAHRKSLEKFVKDNPNLYGINTADFVDFMLDNATMESNNSATAKHGSMYGYYQLKGLKQGSTEEQQHRAAYKHLSNLFNNVITDADIEKAKELGISQAQLLHKFWNQERKVLNYLYQGKDSEDGLGTKISEWGNNNNLEIDYSPYVMKAVKDKNYTIQKGDYPETIMKRYRGYGDKIRTFNNYNKDINTIFGVDTTKSLKIGDVLKNKYYQGIGPIKEDGTFKYGGRKIAQDGTQRSRKKMFSNVTKQIKQIAKQEENRNTPLPIRGEKPITPLGYNIASYAPIVGDAIQLGEGISDIKNRNYIAGAINLGLLALPNAIQGPVKKGIQSAVRKYEIKHLPGYQLKSLMEGNPLEKQLSKDGTISVNSIKAISNKGSKVEKSVIDKVLDTKYAGKKSIDYNDFRKSVQDELITYNRTPDTRYSDYGMDRLFPDPAGRSAGWYGIATPQTFTFSSPRIPNGSGKHYDANTLGHSRTYTTADEPNILHVMESQSDWAQEKVAQKRAGYIAKAEERYPGSFAARRDRAIQRAKEQVENWEELLRTGKNKAGEVLDPWQMEQIRTDMLYNAKRKLSEIERQYSYVDPQEVYLSDNFTSHQIQENLRYAAEKGQSKMRYPTRETAAKIEGYPAREAIFDSNGNDVTARGGYITFGKENDARLIEIDEELKRIENFRENDYSQIKPEYRDEWIDKDRILYEKLLNERFEISKSDGELKPGYTSKVIYDYEDILKKYTEFPKQFKKLYKNADVRTVTDSKGNTWYEVDVPENYLDQEWQYKYGGIHIKPSKRGTFTAAAKKHGMSVQGFASKVLANKGKYSSAMVKKANFARNASKWKHKEFGGDMDFNYWITKDNIYKLGGRKKGQWGLQDYSNSFKVNLQPFVPTTVQGTTTNVNNALSLGIPNIIGAGLNLVGNVGSYFVNRRALKSMQAPVAPSAPIPLRAENLETRVSTAAQEAALRENIAKQENLIAGNLSSSRSRLNAVNAVRNQGIGLYNQLQERKQNVQTELINRAKLNRQQINSQNTLLANQYKDKVTNWKNSVIDFENKRKDALSENVVQHLIQGPIDAIAGERGYFANLENNKRYRISAFLNAIGNPYAVRAMRSGEFLPLAKQFGLDENDLKRFGLM